MSEIQEGREASLTEQPGMTLENHKIGLGGAPTWDQTDST